MLAGAEESCNAKYLEDARLLKSPLDIGKGNIPVDSLELLSDLYLRKLHSEA